MLIAAAAVASVWLGAVAAVWLARRPADADAAPATMELGGEPPAVAAVLCGEYEVRTETAPATVLDLAARDVIALDELQPGETICRVPADPPAGLSGAELHVLAALRSKAVGGVVPATALTTGTADASARWHRELAQLVVRDAQHRGLTVDRWPKLVVRIVGAGVIVVAGLIVLAAQIGGNSDDDPVAAGVAGAAAIGGALLIAAIAGGMRRSLAQRPTPSGSAAESRWLGVRAHLTENEQLRELPPAAVKLYGRHLAYAAGFGLAEHAIEALPFGEEDDHLAWSPHSDQWRRVRVRYPRVRPPAWGRHPVLATLLGIVWGAISIVLLVQVGGISGHLSLIAAAVFALPLLWSIWVLVQAIPDLFGTRTVVGTVLRCRTRPQMLSSRNEPRYWYYVAVDDGTRDRIAAYRVPEARYRAVRQGQVVAADISPRLRYVRALR